MTTLNIVASNTYKTIGGNDGSYATARTTSTYSTTNGVTLGQSDNASPTDYLIERWFVEFNTSSIPSDAVITKVNLNLTCSSDDSLDADFDVQIVEFNWSGSRESDYDGCLSASTSFLWRNTSGMATNTVYTSSNLTTTYINKTGTTKYALRSSRDKNANQPGSYDQETIDFYPNTAATESYRPTLVIEYVLPTGFFLFF